MTALALALQAPKHLPLSGAASAIADGLGPIAGWVKTALKQASAHSGVPVFVVAALALVLSLRLARRMVRIVIEVALVAVMLLVATRCGWIRW